MKTGNDYFIIYLEISVYDNKQLTLVLMVNDMKQERKEDEKKRGEERDLR
jgi:hypothetical protein